MFKIGDKVIDSHTNKIGIVSNISPTENYPISVSFPDIICTYTTSGRYDTETGSRYIKKIVDIAGTVKVGQTHIYIAFSHSTFLLPIALTSFKLVNGIIIATYNGQEYTVYTDNIDQVIEQILNPTKKESL